MDAQLSRYDFARARQEMHNVSSRSVVPERNTSEDDYASQAMQQNTTASISFLSAIVWVSHSCLYALRSRTMPRRLSDGHVLDSIRENSGSLGYGSEVSLLVERQLSLDLEGLFS
jgi:hypothetical protein